MPLKLRGRVSEIFFNISNEMDYADMSAISHERLRELLTQLLAGIKGIAAARQRLDRQINILRRHQKELADPTRQALESGQEDLAQQASAQKDEIHSQLPDLAAEINSLRADEEKFTGAYDKLVAKIETLESRTTATEASHAADDTPPG